MTLAPSRLPLLIRATGLITRIVPAAGKTVLERLLSRIRGTHLHDSGTEPMSWVSLAELAVLVRTATLVLSLSSIIYATCITAFSTSQGLVRSGKFKMFLLKPRAGLGATYFLHVLTSFISAGAPFLPPSKRPWTTRPRSSTCLSAEAGFLMANNSLLTRMLRVPWSLQRREIPAVGIIPTRPATNASSLSVLSIITSKFVAHCLEKCCSFYISHVLYCRCLAPSVGGLISRPAITLLTSALLDITSGANQQ
jgi:hypothetical protein